MIVLIDSDSLCYANAFAVEEKNPFTGEPEVVENGKKYLRSKLDEQIGIIVADSGASDYKMFLTGSGDFRKDLSSTYKANRADMRRPMLLPYARQYLIDNHFAIVVNDMEADDVVCIEQQACLDKDIDSCIAHIDKDIDQQEGKHHRWSIFGKPSVNYTITKEEGLRKLYVQSLVGDKVDNIMYYCDTDGSGTFKKCYGLGQKTAERYLEVHHTEEDMYKAVLNCYLEHPKFIRKDTNVQATEDDLIMNMHMLYMLRTLDDHWEKPV